MALTAKLYDNFCENYKKTGILKSENTFVDFDRFKQIYLSKRLNIRNLINLLSNK